MKRKLEEIIVLYDTHDQGKTSTLRELINVMSGSVPTKGGDLRVIIRNYHAREHSMAKLTTWVLFRCPITPLRPRFFI